MADLQKKRVATEFGETIITSKTQYVSETRKDILISKGTEAKMFKTLRYYNWSKSWGMKTPFLNNLANGAYGTLQLLNDLSAFTSENMARSLAARYGWVVAGRAFGKVQGKVLPQGGGPLGRYMRVKGGQFSRNILGNFMNYFTTTEMEFENVVKTQKSIMKQLDMAGGMGPTWAAMALSRAMSNAPDPFATEAVKTRGENRKKDFAEENFIDGDEKTVTKLQKKTDTLRRISASGASAPEMTYLIHAMESGVDPDDVMSKLKKNDRKIKKALEPEINKRNQRLREAGEPKSELDSVLENIPGYDKDHLQGNTVDFQNTVFEQLNEILGLDIGWNDGRGPGNSDWDSTGWDKRKAISPEDMITTTFWGKRDTIGPDRLKYDEKKIGDSTTDYYNYREVTSSNSILDNNYIANREDIIRGLRISDTQYLHAKNPKGGFLVYGIEFYQHRHIRDIQQIEFGGPATDRKRGFKNRDDHYVYKRSMFLHRGAEEAARQLGIDAKLSFSKRTADVRSTLKQRRTKFMSDIEKGDNQKNKKSGNYSLIVDQKLRNVMKSDLIRARDPRVKGGNKVDFKDISVNDKLIQQGPKPTSLGGEYKGYSTIYLRDEATGVIEPHRLDRKDYPKEYLNAWDRLEENIKKGFRSGGLLNESWLYRSTNISDAEIRKQKDRGLHDKLERNEYGVRRHVTPSIMTRQNYSVKGGVHGPEDIIGQAIKNAEERAFPAYWEELSAIQIDIEEAAHKIFKEDIKNIDLQFKKGKKSSGAKDARHKAENDAKHRREKFIDEELSREKKILHDKYFAELDEGPIDNLEDIKHPLVREEIRKITKQMDSDIRSSGNRQKSQLLPFTRAKRKAKMKKYAEALAVGDTKTADGIWWELTNEGRIEWWVIQEDTGLRGTLTFADDTRNLQAADYDPFVESEAFEVINLDYVNLDGTPKIGPQLVDDNSISEIQNYRDMVNKAKESAQGLNTIPGVGGNVNKSKTNKYGDPTVEKAMSSLSNIAAASGINPELLEAITKREIGKGKGGVPITQVGKGITNPYKEARNYIKKSMGNDKSSYRGDGGSIIGYELGAGLQTINQGSGRESGLKNPLTKLVEAAHQDEESLAILHFILALEDDARVVDVIYQTFDPRSPFAKRATGQVTKRPQNSVSKRYGTSAEVNIAEVNRIRGILRNAESSIGVGLVQAFKDTLFGI